jgi:hypothetical protein
MASNNKRVATKHIRDGIKAQYVKASACEICGIEEALELHHYTTLSLLLKAYAKRNGISIATDEDVLAMRDEFYKQHRKELIEDTVTLCAPHHALLHKTYGKAPPLSSAKLQVLWVQKRRDNVLGVIPNQPDTTKARTEPTSKISLSGFSHLMIRSYPLSDFKV